MVHQQVHIQFRHANCLRNRAKGLPQIIAPLGQFVALLLVFNQVPALAVCGKYPVWRLIGVKHAPEAENPN
jgi:hypothetical protein